MVAYPFIAAADRYVTEGWKQLYILANDRKESGREKTQKAGQIKIKKAA